MYTCICYREISLNGHSKKDTLEIDKGQVFNVLIVNFPTELIHQKKTISIHRKTSLQRTKMASSNVSFIIIIIVVLLYTNTTLIKKIETIRHIKNTFKEMQVILLVFAQQQDIAN